MLDHLARTEQPDRDKPDEDHRAEQPSDRAGPETLHGEQPDEDPEGDRHDQMRQARRRDVQSFDCGDHRDRGRDHPVAEEQAGAEDPERHEHRCPRDLLALDQGGQRHDPAVATVVGAHDEARVLDRHDDHQRPEDQRDDPVDAGDRRARRIRVRGEDHLLGVQRARANVAVHDPERAQREHEMAGVRDDVAFLVGRRAQRVGRSVGLGERGRTHRPVAKLVRRLVEAAPHPRRPAVRAGFDRAARVHLVGGLVIALTGTRAAHRSSGSSAAAAARSRLPRAPGLVGWYSGLVPSVNRVRSMAIPRALTGCGERRRRSSADRTARAASTSRAWGGIAAVMPWFPLRARASAPARPSATRLRLRRRVISCARVPMTALAAGLTPAASSASSLGACHHAISARWIHRCRRPWRSAPINRGETRSSLETDMDTHHGVTRGVKAALTIGRAA
jgi:hypothetical protein